ncbi:enhanced serine sensitivity protein SseB C-terminal domain-containing protein [Thalassotalea sp. Y01]|uniref:enhanced serine sensitivity protein SseB C-terminal domain-containing protein n=1 Tax=Thalassotalea sp. Y01 TaxID=2729613 RepID=UPI00145E8F0A|nr:enhanced serine sensitivity protein SseB C-terminal domain-containing protein [Thalassotalea sp. Y01]NMP16773.1 enhanced serine sensitivity protein SseB [Thalassotalea sp. Y01]
MKSVEENKLEECLRLAANEPVNRLQFCDVLLESEIFLLGTAGEPDEQGTVEAAADSKIQIQQWQMPDGSPVIPFFSSLEVLQKSIDQDESYLALPARSLFELTQGATLFLNPKSDYGKEFLPDEVNNLLTDGVSQSPQQRVVEEETKVLLGQPSIYPAEMVDALTQLFCQHRNVKKAYLALMHDTSIDEHPHLLIGIEVTGLAHKVMTEAGSVASDTVPEGEFVDVVRVEENDQGVSQYLKEHTQPFYERKWGRRLFSWLGSGHA